MPSLQDTAYPRLKHSVSAKELTTLYTPTADELALATRVARGRVPQVAFLILLKTFQRLGYAMQLAEVPASIVHHIAVASGQTITAAELKAYDASATRKRHLTLVRQQLAIKGYSRAAEPVIEAVMERVAQTQQDLVDLINAAIEELVRQRYELPAFSTLVRIARRIRNRVNEQFYAQIAQSLDREARVQLDRLWVSQTDTRVSPWQQVKQDPGKPTLTHLQQWIDRCGWLAQLRCATATLVTLPDAKLKHFAQEAQTFDAAQMKELPLHKRYTLAAALIHSQYAQGLDDLAEMLIKCLQKMHHKAKMALEDYRTSHRAEVDRLVVKLREVLAAFLSEGTELERFENITVAIGNDAQPLLQQCDDHLAYVDDNYFSFLQPYYRVYRAALFRLLTVLPLHSSTQDKALEQAITFIRTHQAQRGEWLALPQPQPDAPDAPLPLDLSWISGKWWGLVTGQRLREPIPTQVQRRYFEMCVFSQIGAELRSGDLYIEGREEFADYSRQLISWQDYEVAVAEYGQMLNLPVESQAFVAHVKQWLAEAGQATDHSFPSNAQVDYKKDRLVIRKPKPKLAPKGLAQLEAQIRERIQPINVLDALTDTQLWLNWSQPFKPISGFDSKLDDPLAHYLAMTFCYGCNIGPNQLTKSLTQFDRKQLARAYHKHTDEGKLQTAIDTLINAYNQFLLPKQWGSGKHASVDGTKWDVYENNLLSEYHIRYGGYGGIGYYHISDTYIALFSHFIPCGVWEAIHIIDALLKNQTDIQPDIIHGDTHAQSTTVFALAYLLGIKLMPRIRNWQQLKLYRPSRSTRYTNIDFLFSDTVDWAQIETHLPDMLRVVLSIKAGKITAATLLRKLGTYSRKNKLFQAFDELGRAIRTSFLLQYINDAEMRQMIHAAINKSESFHSFSKWIAFGSGEIRTNQRGQQRKQIKFNHLVANCLIFYNVVEMSRILNELIQEGYTVEAEAVAALSPYLRDHFNRLGHYSLDLNRRPPAIDYSLPVLSPVTSI